MDFGEIGGERVNWIQAN